MDRALVGISKGMGTKKNKSFLRGCLGCLVSVSAIVLALALITFLFLDYHYNLRSNLVYVEFNRSRSPLELKVDGQGWKSLTNLDPSLIRQAAKRKFENEGYLWQTIRVRRGGHSTREKAVNFAVPSEVHVIEFDPAHYSLHTSFDRKSDGSFNELTAKQVKSRIAPGSIFAINCNYFDYSKGTASPMGLIVSEGKEIISRRAGWSGFFFVKNGKPYFGPTSLFESTSGKLTEAAQGYPSVMKDGQIFSYLNSPGSLNRFFNGKELTFRSLAAVKKDGTVMFVVSGRGGLMNMGEVCSIAKALGANHATLLDGGRALQYEFSRGIHRKAFRAFNNTFEHEGRFAPVRPPAYLVVKPKG
ncbi:MAG: phosphodiester glycosidase family protein [Verrucomicrobiota bacterium]